MAFLATKGERVLLVGQTGSGKTANAIFQLKNAPVFPVIIFDTKIEPQFFSLADDGDSLDLVQSIDEFLEYSKKSPKQWADYILVRPGVNEIQDFDILNDYCRLAFQKFGSCTVYYDELYNWHNRGIPVNWFVGLLTRGRSKGKTVIQSTQRPGWISRFCFTESQKFFIHQLIDSRDRQTLDSMVPNFSSYPIPPKFHFYRFEVGADDAPKLCLPVPYEPVKSNQIFSRKWL